MIESEKFIQILKISNRIQRVKLLALISDSEKQEFGRQIAKGILKGQLPCGSPVVFNWLIDNYTSSNQAFKRISSVVGIKQVTGWLLKKSVTLQQVAMSDELKNSFTILHDENSSDHHVIAASKLVQATIFVIDFNQPELENKFFDEIMMLQLSSNNKKLERSKALCKILVSLGEKFMSKIVIEGHYSRRVVNSIFFFTDCPETTQLTFTFWHQLANWKISDRKSEFSALLENVMLNLAKCLKHSKMFMESESANQIKFQSDISKVISDIARVVNPQRTLKRFAWILYQPDVTSIDAEIALIFIEKIAKYVDITDNQIVPDLIENLLKCPKNSIFMPQCIKIIGMFQKCFTSNIDMTLKALNFLGNALCCVESIADLAAEAIDDICECCKQLMTPLIEDFYNIFANLHQTNLSKGGKLKFVHAIAIVVNYLPADQLTIVMQKICKTQFERIFNFSHLSAIESIDQLAEIFACIVPESNKHSAASVFIECWPVLSNMMQNFHSNEILDKIIEVLKCGVKSYGFELLPILDDIIEQSLMRSNSFTCRTTLKLITAVFNSSDGNIFSNQLMKIFEATSTMTFNVLLGEKTFDSDIGNKFFELANIVARKFTLQLMQSPCIIPCIELAINSCCVDTEDLNAFKFLATLLTVEDVQLLNYQREIKCLYSERIIYTLLHSSIFIFSDTLKFEIIFEIFNAFKSTSIQGFSEQFSNSFYLLPNKNSEGKVAVKGKNLEDFFTAVNHPNLTKKIFVENMKVLKNFYK